mmetsp:Transcript_12511/g.28752  ORF Transcript_12511/g.28752 Transcript_12511/m.28752 type:complete len:296 (-) Transcript_12511:584-1471(-)
MLRLRTELVGLETDYVSCSLRDQLDRSIHHWLPNIAGEGEDPIVFKEEEVPCAGARDQLKESSSYPNVAVSSDKSDARGRRRHGTSCLENISGDGDEVCVPNVLNEDDGLVDRMQQIRLNPRLQAVHQTLSRILRVSSKNSDGQGWIPNTDLPLPFLPNHFAISSYCKLPRIRVGSSQQGSDIVLRHELAGEDRKMGQLASILQRDVDRTNVCIIGLSFSALISPPLCLRWSPTYPDRVKSLLDISDHDGIPDAAPAIIRGRVDVQTAISDVDNAALVVRFFALPALLHVEEPVC